MKKKIITVSREFGSGGRTIGKRVAQQLNIPYYDKELVKQVALESGFDPKFIEEQGEFAPSRNRFAYAFLGRGVPGAMGIIGVSPQAARFSPAAVPSIPRRATHHHKEVLAMKKKIITVSREFGSGGRTIGKRVAQQLNIPYYDKELVKQVALESGFDPKFIEEQGEFAPSRNRFAYAFLGRGVPGAMGGMSASDFLWTIQHRVIRDLADKGPCVIVGRCADYILKDRDDCLHTFIHASMEFRADRIVRLYGESEQSPEKRLTDKDTRRRVNYKHYTDREWGMAQNYHITLDSGLIGIEKCVDIILDLVQDKTDG